MPACDSLGVWPVLIPLDPDRSGQKPRGIKVSVRNQRGPFDELPPIAADEEGVGRVERRAEAQPVVKTGLETPEHFPEGRGDTVLL